MKKLLFISEAVSLAHVIRPLALIDQLSFEDFEIFFAVPNKYFWMVKNQKIVKIDLITQNPEHYEKKIKNGEALFNEKVLESQIEYDLKIIKEINPDLIIGDFRLSLNISCELTNKIYMNITDAHWYPTTESIPFPMPSLPLTKLPLPIARYLFNLFSSYFMKLHLRPYLKLRQKYNLPITSNISLKSFYAKSDFSIFSSYKFLYEHMTFDEKCTFAGYLHINFPIDKPFWWSEAIKKTQDGKSVYISMGSTGSVDDIELIIETLLIENFIIFISTANRIELAKTHANLYIASYLPGEEIVEHVDLMICHGGTMTAQQSLYKGTPVLCIPQNMDQYLFSERIREFKAGEIIRSDRVTAKKVRELTLTIINDQNYKKQALIYMNKAKDHKNEFNLNLDLIKN